MSTPSMVFNCSGGAARYIFNFGTTGAASIAVAPAAASTAVAPAAATDSSTATSSAHGVHAAGAPNTSTGTSPANGVHVAGATLSATLSSDGILHLESYLAVKGEEDEIEVEDAEIEEAEEEDPEEDPEEPEVEHSPDKKPRVAECEIIPLPDKS